MHKEGNLETGQDTNSPGSGQRLPCGFHSAVLLAAALAVITGGGSLLAQDAGFQVARALLDAIVAHGCALDQGWVDREGGKVAAVKGRVPVDLVLAQASAPAAHAPRINMLEARPDYVRVVGLAFEEYVINGPQAL